MGNSSEEKRIETQLHKLLTSKDAYVPKALVVTEADLLSAPKESRAGLGSVNFARENSMMHLQSIVVQLPDIQEEVMNEEVLDTIELDEGSIDERFDESTLAENEIDESEA